MDWITSPEGWIALLTLTVLEIVLGIDNIVFISILAGRLPSDQRERARKLGLSLAMLIRVGLLLSIAWMMQLTTPLVSFAVVGQDFSGRDLILLGGGLFLIAKSTHEIHVNLEGDVADGTTRAAASFGAVIVQILLLDIVFSLDSVITAVGMAEDVAVMVLAIVIAVGVMLLSSRGIGEFVERHPTVKMLALSFLLLIGMSLLLEGFGQHIRKGYIYFAMGFSVFVEMINLRIRSRTRPVQLHQKYTDEAKPVAGSR